MTAKELTRIFSKGECLSLETMKLYSDGKLPKKSAHVVEKHLLECGLCAGAMDGLNSKRIAEVTKLSSHIQRRLAVYMNTPPQIPFFRRFGFAIIAGILLISGGSTILYFSTRTKNDGQQLSDSILKPSSQQTSLNSGGPAFNSPGSTDNGSSNTTGTSPLVNDRNLKTNAGGNTNSNSLQNLPATQPGKDNTFTVNPQQNASSDNSQPNVSTDGGPNTRMSNENPLIHIRNIQVYTPVTHDDGKSGRKTSSEGQLGRSTSGNASFQLEDMPKYPGGDEALKAYLSSNFKAMTIDRSKTKRFSTGIIITVNSRTGEVSNPQLSFSISPEVDAELLRVLNNMPNWNPGKKRGEVDVMIGITFE